MGGRGYSNHVEWYLDGNRRTVEFQAALKTPDGKIDILYDKVSPRAPTMPIFSNSAEKIYAVVGKNGEIKAIGFYNDKHVLTKTIHLDHDDRPTKGPHVHIGDAYHHKSGSSRKPTAAEEKTIAYIKDLWARKGK